MIKLNLQSNYPVTDEKGNKTTFSLENLICDSRNRCQVPAWGNALAHLLSLKVVKKIYSPNYIEAVLHVDSNNQGLPDLIVKSLLDGKAMVTDTALSKDFAAGYLVHEVTPTVYTGERTVCDVTIKAYSPDKMLTYDKFSMAHTAKRLCQDIIPSQLDGSLGSVFSKEWFKKNQLHNTMFHDKEIIMPYLVQYNESFYDFIRRTTYRSGEYMFFEDGQLHIGLDVPEDKDVPEMKFGSRTPMGRHTSRMTASALVSHHHDIYGTDKKALYSPNIAYNEECSAEEYGMMLQDNPVDKSYWSSGQSWMTAFVHILSQETYFDMVGAAASDVFGGEFLNWSSNKDSNEDFNKLYSLDKDNSDEHYGKEKVDGKERRRFTPYLMYNSVSKVMAGAYREIRNGEEMVEAGRQHLELNAACNEVYKLGQVVTLFEGSGKYVIVSLSRSEEEQNKARMHYSIEVVPLNPSSLDSKPSNLILPPKQDDIETVRKIDPQTAFITATKDDGGMGRVQVRFHWQTADGDQTPLIRRSSQMASSDAGVQFMPNVGDEVIINFTNGNAELPYVAGALFNKINKAPAASEVIRSNHGHTISFSDAGDDRAFAKSIFPFYSWTSALSSHFDAKDSDKLKDVKKDIKAAYDKVKAKTANNDCKTYNAKCKQLEYSKSFLKKAIATPVVDPIVTDRDILKKKYEMKADGHEVDIEKLTSKKYATWDSDITLFNIRKEIQVRKEKIKSMEPKGGTWFKTVAESQEYEDLKNSTDTLEKFYQEAIAIDDSVVIKTFFTLSDDQKQDKRYLICHDADFNNADNILPNSSTLQHYNTKYNNIDRLQAFIDDTVNASCEGYVSPDAPKTDDADYKTFYDLFQKLVKAKKAVDNDKDTYSGNFHTGGITMADDAGIYKLDLNATSRSITIDSPMGTVKINALTGITISAPNGDVNIKGKNVNIEAGNNISITSGKNKTNLASQKEIVHSVWDFAKEHPGLAAVGAGMFIGVQVTPEGILGAAAPKPFVDMKTLRCVMECFARPLESTLKIHTENNLMLEAGGKGTSTDMSNMKHLANQKKVTSSRASMVAAGVQTLNNIYDEIAQMAKNTNSALDDSVNSVTVFIDTRINAAAGTPEGIACSSLINKFSASGGNPAKIVEEISKAATGSAKKTNYKMEELYDPASNANVTFADLKKDAEKDFVRKPGTQPEKDTFNSVIKAKHILRELQAATDLVNGIAPIFGVTKFKEKSDDLGKYSTWFLADTKVDDTFMSSAISGLAGKVGGAAGNFIRGLNSMNLFTGIGLNKETFVNIGTYVGKLKIAPVKIGNVDHYRVCDENGNALTDAMLLKEKRKLFYKIATHMVDGQISNRENLTRSLLVNSPRTAMAYYDAANGAIPDETEANKNWDKFIDPFTKNNQDSDAMAKAASTLHSVYIAPLEQKLLNGFISETYNGLNDVMSEYKSLETEAQGNIYFTSKDNGTAKLNENAFKPSQGIKAGFDDIKESLKKDVTW